LDGIACASLEAHYRLYQGYVGKRNEILANLDRGVVNGWIATDGIPAA